MAEVFSEMLILRGKKTDFSEDIAVVICYDPVVDFTNILCEAFKLTDPKNTKDW